MTNKPFSYQRGSAKVTGRFGSRATGQYSSSGIHSSLELAVVVVVVVVVGRGGGGGGGGGGVGGEALPSSLLPLLG